MAAEADLNAPVVVDSGVVESERMSCLVTVVNAFLAQEVIVAPVDVQAPVPGRWCLTHPRAFLALSLRVPWKSKGGGDFSCLVQNGVGHEMVATEDDAAATNLEDFKPLINALGAAFADLGKAHIVCRSMTLQF